MYKAATIAILSGAVQDTGQTQRFLEALTQDIPTRITECVARDWNIPRPPAAEARRLRWESWSGSAHTNPITLDSVRAWWTARPVEYRTWAVCEGNFRDRLFTGLRPVIEHGQMLPVIERLLISMADTTRLTEAQYVIARIRSDTIAANIVVAAKKFGDPHRYDGAITDDYNGWGGYWYYRGMVLALLGRLYFIEGRLSDARHAGLEAKRLLRWADPFLLTDIALQQHDTLTALRELAFCRVAAFSCSNTPERDFHTAHQLVALYRAINKGAATGLDTILKGALRDSSLRFPIPIPPWQENDLPKGRHSRRATLLQYYTWVHCGNCAPHTIGAEALRQRYGEHLIVLSYHYAPPLTIPGWVSYPNFETTINHLLHVGRKIGNDQVAVSGPLCDWWIGGECMYRALSTGSGVFTGLALYDQAAPHIEHQLHTPTSIQVALQTVMQKNRVVTTATTEWQGDQETMPVDELKLQIVLVEDSVLISGGNSPIQNHLVRAVAGDSATGFGTLLSKNGSSHTVHQVFDLSVLEHIFRQQAVQARKDDPSSWNEHVFHFDRTQLSIVAYVQNQRTGEVLQVIEHKVSSVGQGVR